MAERIGKLRVSKVVKAGWGYGRKVGSLGRLSAEGWQHRQRRLGLQVTSLYSEVRRRSARTTVSYLPSAAVGHLNAVGSRRAEALLVQMIGEANSMRWASWVLHSPGTRKLRLILNHAQRCFRCQGCLILPATRMTSKPPSRRRVHHREWRRRQCEDEKGGNGGYPSKAGFSRCLRIGLSWQLGGCHGR
jgi:hypothetical protein